MRLEKVHIREFQSVLDSTEFEVGDITCLVGKNEAGKTAVLRALYRLNPIVESEGQYSVTDDYPRWDVEDYRLAVEKGKQPTTVARAVFQLDDTEVEAIGTLLGPGVLPNRQFVLWKGYANHLGKAFSLNEKAALKNLAERHCPPEVVSQLPPLTDVAGAMAALGKVESTPAVAALQAELQTITKQQGLHQYVYEKVLKARIPTFLYFDEYYQMEGRANIEALQKRIAEKNLRPSDHPLLGLINRARLKVEELLTPSRTRELKNRLEGSGNHLTKQVVKYWSQNRYLQLRFDVRQARPEDPGDMKAGTNIWSDVYDSKHMVTTELGTRSRGFVWFFSFLAWYGDVRSRDENVILLLDEPGLSLHAKAQEDLLRYFETEVKGQHQLIYTTHSPFMVDATHFERVRIVQDKSIETDGELPPEQQGTKVLTDVLEATPDSLFPLQGALGYEIYQTLFIGPNCLVVEGVSDLLYIQVVSGILEQKGRTGLDRRWTITPVGGADKVPTFVALIGTQRALNVAVLVDFQKKNQQMLENLYKKKLLEQKKVVTFADFTGTAEADIEDMFEPDFYIGLVNSEFESQLKKAVPLASLSPGPRITVRLEKYLEGAPLKSGSFNHYRPARYFLEKSETFKDKLSAATLDRFEAAFKRLNALL